MSSVAQTLPAEILLSIFRWSLDTDPEHAHGGRLVKWDSNGSIATMATVCRSWSAPANALLYSSVAVFGARSAEMFVETSQTRPDLTAKILYLVIGLGKAMESAELDLGQAADSEALLSVIAACENVLHLQIRPLHGSTRHEIIQTLHHKQLASLVCTPRLDKPAAWWSLGMLEVSDVAILAQPSLKDLELDYAVEPTTPPSAPSSSPDSPPSTFTTPLALVRLRLHLDLPETVVCSLLAAATTLEVVDVYLESPLYLDRLGDAILESKHTLKSLSLLSNPIEDDIPLIARRNPPLLNRIVPQLPHLVDLVASSTEICTKIVPLLPSSLRRLTVRAFNDRGEFLPTPDFFEAIQDPSTGLALTNLRVYDSDEAWTEEDVVKTTKLCRARGVSFSFAPEDSSSDGSSE